MKVLVTGSRGYIGSVLVKTLSQDPTNIVWGVDTDPRPDGSTLFGHCHTIDEHSIPGLERRVARASGALCQLDMDYNSRMPVTLRHANGWAFGVINKTTGKYHSWQAERVDGKWIIPSDIIEL